ncbi:hypothetical protein JRO89_XS07G0137900 [Xanthoceras sorbifolium]|uniref:Uncharacterized protein n=1 Tax=Xanthoceras sorbifolium TaxID=99658 RepID=A0ABQ8HTP8_9ROSI|nr:hypothetical protein JRO89_XS07G0137900 [Xanthoceras sorbifolium]
MALSSRASLPSHFSVIPEKISQIGKPNLFQLSSSPPISLKLSIIHHNYNLVSNSSKHSTFPSGQPLFTESDIHHEHAQNVKVFKHILSEVGEDPSQGLAMIAVQRLGIDYHFQDEIEQILPTQYMIAANTYGDYDHHDHDLQEVALRFRLLRQEGYNVPADVFNNFKNNEGKFKSNVSKGIKGLMGLFEASQLSISGEDVLNEAEEITAKFLNEWLMHLDNYQATVVGNTLRYPHHKSLLRFVAKNLFLSNYQGENGWIHVFQELAKIDFNVVQSLHQKEIVQVSKWWKGRGLAEKLGFARDQPVKWYIWSMACLTDPSLWDHAASEQMPEYLRICFEALNDITDEIIEAKWFASGQLPKTEEYLENGTVSSGVHVELVHIFFLLGQNITSKNVELIDNNPGLISSTAAILRLWDDLGSANGNM